MVTTRIDKINSFWDKLLNEFKESKLYLRTFNLKTEAKANEFIEDFENSNYLDSFSVKKHKLDKNKVEVRILEEYQKQMKKSKNKETTEEFEGSSKGTGALYEFFTPDEVVKRMWQLAYENGFTKGNILEPALGSGRLLKYAPEGCNLTAFEISKENFELSKRVLSPYFKELDIYNQSFETAFLEAPRFNSKYKKGLTWLKQTPFDLVIANPPYGKFTGLYKTHFKFSGQFEHFFIEYTMKLVKSGGLGVFLVPSSFLRNGITYTDVKERIFAECSLVDAYRLPNSIFKKTKVGTDIIILKKK